MKTLLLASSALALMTAPALAQDYQEPGETPTAAGAADDRHAGYTDDHPLVGLGVYTSDGERVGSVEKVRGVAAAETEFDSDSDGPVSIEADALIIETGGFLGIGTREVRIDGGQAEWTRVDGDERVLLDISHDAFEDLPRYDDASDRDRDRMGAGAATDRDTRATMTRDRDSEDRARTDRHDAYTDDHPLVGLGVYTADGERVGSVEKVRGAAVAETELDSDSDDPVSIEADALIVETGGFLGIGTREVRVDGGQAEWTRVDGDERVLLDMSHDTFEDLPRYDDASDRDATARDRDRQDRPYADARTDRTDRDDRYDAYTEDHPLVGLGVYTADGERVGSVEKVRGGAVAETELESDSDGPVSIAADALIVETGGFLGIGTREVRIDGGQAEWTRVDGDERVLLDISHDAFEDLPRYDENGADRDRDDLDRARDWERPETRTDQMTEPGATQTRQRDGLTEGYEARREASGEVHGDVYTDGHHWVGTPVYSSDGERLGSVEKVRAVSDVAYADGGDEVAMTEAEPDVQSLIVETGGFLGLGTREVSIDADDAELEMVDGDSRLVLNITEDEFRNLPEHDERRERARDN